MKSPLRFLSVVAASILGTLIAFGVAFLLLIFFVMVMAAGADSSPSIRSGSVLVIDLSRPVPELVSGDPIAQSFAGEAPFGLFDLTRAIHGASGDRRISALWLRTGNTTTSWATLQAIRRSLVQFRESGKPVVASSKSFMMEESSYYLASAADSVFADPESMFEFNGFAVTVSHYKELLDRLGIEPQIVRAGSYKSAVEPFVRSNLSDENRLQLQAIVDDIMVEFVGAVGQSRGLEPTALSDRMRSDAIFSAREAVEAGLLDGLRFDDEIRDRIAEMADLDPEKRLREVSIHSYARLHSSRSRSGSGNIAVVYVDGGITPGASSDMPNPILGGSTVGSESFIKAIRQARKSKRTLAIVVRVNSPGGFAPAADAMLREIQRTAEDIPVVISMGDMAASGGYWIATGASTIVAESLTLTGSIGVFSLFFNTSEFFEKKLGVTFDEVGTGPYSDMFSGLRPYSRDEEALLQRSTDDTYHSFLEKVSASRDIPINDVDGLAQGRIWTGRAALEKGLIDEVGGLERAVAIAAENAGIEAGDIRIRILPTPRSFFERLNDAFASIFASVVSRAEPSGSEQILMNAIRRMTEVVRTSGSVQALMPYTLTIH